MRRTALVFAFFTALVLLQSCTAEEIETQPKPVPTTVDYTDAMMQRDSVSRNEDEIDPPTVPVIKK
ncbi:hypothetical protein FLJC2902T_12130 [Flavobacterium limnosediminis JC2902]|uniref:Secreted protein n=1 Tax=Flavobacterium limnosediminis JC2902 TaxID=1341181 RepID=V6SRC1_9FLAO|nr:hypothetical protein [Flavobacterium limnosediminis]ESU29171.1 hypothetical protein FLJC2902T_12130 [Flavobacterium limnosediminis JC2902]